MIARVVTSRALVIGAVADTALLLQGGKIADFAAQFLRLQQAPDDLSAPGLG